MAKEKKGGLGKGLDLIFSENMQEEDGMLTELRLSAIEPNREQPRKEFDEEALAELADSIAQNGILQPLLVRPLLDGSYQIVAGERRWRAARMAGLKTVPVLVRELTQKQTMELALIENLQREDLSPLEEATGYATLMEVYDMTQEEVANVMGKSRPAITNALRLLKLPAAVQTMIEEGKLTAGHGRVLLTVENDALCTTLAERAVKEDLSVRSLEQLCKKLLLPPKNASLPRIPYYQEVALAMKTHLHRKVQVVGNEEKGSLQIEFYGEEDLTALLQALRFMD